MGHMSTVTSPCQDFESTMKNETKLAIVTGTSSGIGLALAKVLLDGGWRVVGLARRTAAIDAPGYTHITADLGDLTGLRAIAEADLAPILAVPDLARVGLVNNAATIGALTWMRAADPQHLGRMFAVNAAAPMYLMGFVTNVMPESARLRIVNISSGAAHSPFPGLGDYSATKAALRLAGRTLAAEFEQADRTPRDAAVFSYEPGLVDTAMQDQARAASPDVFPAHGAFEEFAAKGMLNPPAAVVGDIIAFLDGDPAEYFTESRFDSPD